MNYRPLRLAVLLIAGVLVAFPDDLEDAFQSLKEAAEKKNASEVKKLAAEVCALARQEASKPAPQDSEQKEIWAKRVAFARDVETYTEYALYVTAVEAQPGAAVELFSALEQQNPKSKYLDSAYTHYFIALTRSGAAAKIPAIAERAIAHFPDNEDLLLVLADACMSRQQTARAGVYAEKLIRVISQHPQPEGVSAADWQKKKTAALTRAYWIAGIAHAEKNEYLEADKDLRAALPLVKGDNTMLAAALFHLGVVNYQLGRAMLSKARVLEAARFSDQAAAIPGPYAQQAWRNAGVMRNEAARMR